MRHGEDPGLPAEGLAGALLGPEPGRPGRGRRLGGHLGGGRGRRGGRRRGSPGRTTPLLFKSFNFDGAFAMPSFWNNVEIAHRLKVQLKQLHANVDSCMQILLCERRGRKYAFLYATVWFFKL